MNSKKTKSKYQIISIIFGWLLVVGWPIVSALMNLPAKLFYLFDCNNDCVSLASPYFLILALPIFVGATTLMISITEGLKTLERVVLITLGAVVISFISWWLMTFLKVAFNGLG